MLGVALTTPALSAEWVFDGRLDPRVEYDDNVLLRDSKDSSMVYKVSPTLNLSRSLENSSVKATIGYDIERYGQLSELDTENPFASLSGSYQSTRSAYSLNASYREQTVRSIAEEDTGDFSSNAIVRSRTIAPGYQYQLTERDSLLFSASYSERRYDASRFADNDTLSISTGWSRSLTERLSGGLNLSYVQFESESTFIESDYDSYNLAVTGNYAITERWQVNGQVGRNYLKSRVRFVGTDIRQTATNTGSLASIAITHLGHVDSLSLNLSRSLNPSGEGVLNEQDRIAVNYSRDLSERLSFNLGASYSETTSADDISRTDRKFTDISPSLKWMFARNVSVNAGYRYREQRGNTESNVKSNAVFVSVGYDWDGFRFSR